MTKRKFLLQGIALTAFSLFFRITNIGYRAYLSGKIGAEGMGLYQLIFSVFLLAITLSTSGISLAVTRMVTAAIAANHRCTVRSVVTQCFLFCLTVSCTIAVLLLCFSDFAAAHLFIGLGQCYDFCNIQVICRNRKVEGNEHVADLVVFFHFDELFFPGNIGSSNAAEGDAFAMQHLKAAVFLDCMTDRVSEV